MIDYSVPKFQLKLPKRDHKKNGKSKNVKPPAGFKNPIISIVLASILTSTIFGFLAGIISGSFFYTDLKEKLAMININLPEKIIEKETVIEKEYVPQTTQEQTIIDVVKSASPAVVSIVVAKDLPVIEQYFYNPFEGSGDFFGNIQVPGYRQNGTEKRIVGGGTGFLITKDGTIITNKHVVLDDEAYYTVVTSDGKEFEAKILAKDPIEDLAVLKIEGEVDFPVLNIGDSDKLQIGQTVIAIGNALGEFQNTVSVGVISGLSRTIEASGGGFSETLRDIVQTDAAINKGNSGGPLLNLRGEVVGINTATSLEGQNIGFAIPINQAEKDIEQIKKLGKIVYPFLGVKYVILTKEIKEKYNLPVDYGAYVVTDESGVPAIIPDSPADKAGLQQGDIILQFGDEKINAENGLAEIISKYKPGDEIMLEVLRNGKKKFFMITLTERSM
ncbi:MAG: trypsin-like peptidase domain-containing protein [Patescibacteria group bacterium]